MFTTTQLQDIYKQWLQGESLRTVAGKSGVTHSTIHTHLKKAFGERATNRKAASLYRSLLEDYPDSPEVLEWVMKLVTDGVLVEEGTFHRSNHSLDVHSQYQTLQDDQLMYTIAASEDTEESTLDFLRLPLYLLVSDSIYTALNLAREGAGRVIRNRYKEILEAA